jgi:hypothetical protein
MLRERRRERPRRPFGAPAVLATARLRRLVDDVHGGSLVEAAAFAGVPYAALREIHAGRASAPPRATLERIATTYGLPPDWFTAPDDGTVPAAGWVGFLPSEPGPGPAGPGRRVTIPFGAWPLIRVLVRLEQRLRDLPASPDRPILGGATDPRECRRRLTAFIFQPLLAAGQGCVLEARPGAHRVEAVGMLRNLGHFWEQALGNLLADDRPAPSLSAH